MEQRNYSARMRHENGNAVSDRNSENDPPLRGKVTVSGRRAQQAFPAAAVRQHCRAVYLPADNRSLCKRRELVLEMSPPRHDFADGRIARKTERAGIAGGRECADPKSCEFSYILSWN
jgi:hypothetical protein